MEIWKEIKGSVYFAISNKGRLKRLPYYRLHNINKTYFLTKEKILKASNNNSKGYWRKEINYKNGKTIHESIHRLVAKAFIPNPNNLPQVNHIDGDKNNNCVENLEWCENHYNMIHSFKIGLRKNSYVNMSGEKSYLNKYSERLIKKIPKLVKMGYSYLKISKMLHIPSTLITEIKSKRAWKSLNIEIPDSKFCKKKI